MFDPERFITDRVRYVDASGIRRVFDLAASIPDPLNLSIGQPDFDVPESIKQTAIRAIHDGFNRYTVTQGIPEIRDKVAGLIRRQFPHWVSPQGAGGFGTLITSGVSGGLLLAMLTCVGPGDEVLIPDPYFVMYRHLVTLVGAKAVYVDTYPDFQLTARRLEPHLTDRTKLLLFNSPSNPTGVIATDQTCREVVALAHQHNVLVLSDEIYDRFCYEVPPPPEGETRKRDGDRSQAPETDTTTVAETVGLSCRSPASFSRDVLLLRGFSKTYGMTGWRLGYAVGPQPIIEQMTKLQQYTFVCAPSMAQLAGVTALDTDMTPHIQAYRNKRDLVVQRLRGTYELTPPGGAFYAFPRVPEHLGLSGSQFVERAVQRGLLIIPGSVFSNRDTHFRLSYACDTTTLQRGLDLLLDLADG